MLAAFGLACALAAPAAAQEWTPDGTPWPGGRITYFDASRYWHWPVRQAVDEWNRSGVGARFVRVFDRSRADVIVVSKRFDGPVAGRGTLGYPFGYQAYVELDTPGSFRGDEFAMAGVAAHELGHVLGLGHRPRPCTLMYGGGELCRRWRTPFGMWRCRLLERHDVSRAVAMYGGTVRPLRTPVNCFRYPMPDPPSALEAAVVQDAEAVRLSWVNPTGPGASQTLIKRKLGSCASSPSDPDAVLVDRLTRSGGDFGRRGGRRVYVDVPGEYGTFCYSVWSGDESGRGRIRRPAATVHIVLDPPPRPAHDDFAEAAPIDALPYTSETSAEHATLEAAEPPPSCGPDATSSVWYRLTAPADSTIAIDTVGSTYDTVLAAFEGDALAHLSELACNDDTDGVTSRVDVSLVQGQTLWIQVTAFSGEAGALTISIYAN